MTRAEQMQAALINAEMDWTDLLNEAEEIGDAYEQDYENEMTYFEFADGSVAVFNGIDRTIATYGCK